MQEDKKKEDKMEKKFDLNIHVARLLLNEPFFAALSRRVDKRPTDLIPTAGVKINPESAQFEMYYNPAFFEQLSDEERKDVLKHEMYHLIFEHLTDRRPDNVDLRVWNFATDLAINSHLSNLPKGCLKPGQGRFKDYPSGQSSEWYLEKLKEEGVPPKPEPQPGEPGDESGQGGGSSGSGEGEGNEDQENKDGSGGDLGDDGQFDSHEWEEVDASTKEMAKERLKDNLRKASEECSRSNSWGSVPSEVRKDIMKRLSSLVDWKKVLRYFIKCSQKANKSTTIKRINRRYPYVHPGRKTNRQASIAISIDQSGSVSDAMLAAFFAELNKLADLATFTVIPFDCTVAEDKVFVWKKGESRPWERVRYGGTDFNPPTEYVNKKGFDGHIVLTDMCAPKPKPSLCQRMWMTTDYYARNPYFTTNERVISIQQEGM